MGIFYEQDDTEANREYEAWFKRRILDALTKEGDIITVDRCKENPKGTQYRVGKVINK